MLLEDSAFLPLTLVQIDQVLDGIEVLALLQRLLEDLAPFLLQLINLLQCSLNPIQHPSYKLICFLRLNHWIA